MLTMCERVSKLLIFANVEPASQLKCQVQKNLPQENVGLLKIRVQKKVALQDHLIHKD